MFLDDFFIFFFAGASAVNVLTDVAQPGSPQIVNVTRVADNALLVEWTAPKEVFRRLDFYLVEYSQASGQGDVVNVQQLIHLPVRMFIHIFISIELPL